MAETMTPADLLREVAVRGTELAISAPTTDERDACLAGADALDRLARTCATCHHARSQRGGVVSCVPPVGPEVVDSAVHAQFPFWGLVVPSDERCKGWAKREDA